MASGNLEPVALTNPRSGFHSSHSTHSLSFWLLLLPLAFSSLFSLRLVSSCSSFPTSIQKKKVLFLSLPFHKRRPSLCSTTSLPSHPDTMASTRVLASRLASQMAPKVARPALRVQVAKRTIASKFPVARDRSTSIRDWRLPRNRIETELRWSNPN